MTLISHISFFVCQSSAARWPLRPANSRFLCKTHKHYCIYSTITTAFGFLFNLLPEITPCTRALLSWPVLASTPSCGTTTSRSTYPVSTGLGSAWSYLHRLSVKFCLVFMPCLNSALLLRYFTHCTKSYMKSAKTRKGKLLLLLPFSILLELRMTEVVVTTGASWPTNQHPAFYMPHALSVAQPTASQHYRQNDHRLTRDNPCWSGQRYWSFLNIYIFI